MIIFVSRLLVSILKIVIRWEVSTNIHIAWKFRQVFAYMTLSPWVILNFGNSLPPTTTEVLEPRVRQSNWHCFSFRTSRGQLGSRPLLLLYWFLDWKRLWRHSSLSSWLRSRLHHQHLRVPILQFNHRQMTMRTHFFICFRPAARFHPRKFLKLTIGSSQASTWVRIPFDKLGPFI